MAASLKEAALHFRSSRGSLGVRPQFSPRTWSARSQPEPGGDLGLLHPQVGTESGHQRRDSVAPVSGNSDVRHIEDRSGWIVVYGHTPASVSFGPPRRRCSITIPGRSPMTCCRAGTCMGLAEALERVACRVGLAIPRADLHGVALSVLNVLSTVGPPRMSQLAERARISSPA